MTALMTKPLLLWSHWTIASFILIAISHWVAAPASADDSLNVEELPIKAMADNSHRSTTMLQTHQLQATQPQPAQPQPAQPQPAQPQSTPLIEQRLARMQVIRQIQSSGQIWMTTELADQPNGAYQDALARTWQDFWQQPQQSIEQFNQLLQVHYWGQQA
jgi:hypothetical protein